MNEIMKTLMQEANNEFDLSMMKIDAFMEASVRTFAINRNEAELKVMTESGTDADLAYLYEEAEASFAERLRATLDKIKDSILDFLTKVREKFYEFATSVKAKLAIEKIEKKIKSIPLFSKKKVKVPNTDKAVEVCDKHIANIDRLSAKVAAGQDVSDEEIEAVETNFWKEHEKVLKAGAAAVTVIAVSAALIMYRDKLKTVPNKLKDQSVKVKDYFDAVVNKASSLKDGAAEKASAITSKLAKLARTRSKIEQAAANDLIDSATDLMTAMTDEAAGAVETIANAVAESSENENVIDTEVTEGSDDYLDPGYKAEDWDSIMNNLDVPASVFNLPAGECTKENAEEEVEESTGETSTFESLMSEIDNLFE